MNNQKRIFLGIGLILFSLGMGYLLFRVFFSSTPIGPGRPTSPTQTSTPGTFPNRGDAGETPSTGGNQGTGTLPDSNQNNTGGTGVQDFLRPENPVKTVFSGNAKTPKLSANGNLQFYNQSDGKFYRIDAAGNAKTLSDEVFFSADTITWDNKGDQAIIEYPDGSNIVYNFTTKKQVTLPKHWEEFSFSNDNSQIAAKSMPLSPENRFLVTTDISGNNVKLIEPLGDNANKVIVDWSKNSQVVAFSRTGQALGSNRQEVLLVGQNNENFKSLIVEGRDFRPQWTPDGKKVLYSVYSKRNDYKPELWIVNGSGDEIGSGRKYLNLETWADKCNFGSTDSRYVYCGVPEQLDTGAGFVPETANTTRDRIYKIDTVTGAKTELVGAETSYLVVDSLQVDEKNNKLYITNKINNNVIEFNL